MIKNKGEKVIKYLAFLLSYCILYVGDNYVYR